MTGDLIEAQSWAARRWWSVIGLIFVTQLGLIFWLGRSHRVVAVRNDPAPTFALAGPGANEILALTDPTLFALPHRETFSGSAWLTIPTQELKPFSWSEAPRLLALDQERLGDAFRDFMGSNEVNSLPAIDQPELQLKMPALAKSEPLVTNSTLRLMGLLSERRLLVAPVLPSWPAAELLSNSVVQLLVTSDGKPVSPTLLKPGSGSAEADQQAVREARKARFEPLRDADPTDPMAGLTSGQMVFEWHTLPLAPTNSPVEAVSPK